MSTSQFEKYVGLPFKEDGEPGGSFNCWGLVRLVLEKEAFVKNLPQHSESTAGDIIDAAKRFATFKDVSGPWIAVERADARRFDCVLMTAMSGGDKPRRLPGHVGVLLSETLVLHIWSATSSVIVPLTHPSVSKKILGFFRHRHLA